MTVCSGIEAPTVAWHPLGWKPLAFSEIDRFPSAALAHHYPDVPNLGDMTKYKEWPDYEPGLICGGTPCQSFSVAGLRRGMDDPRGNLTLMYLGIIARYNPRWVIWENVPGVFSSISNGESDFGRFLKALAELGYSCAYRVLDAQFFGVPQRRRRVFVVGHLGDDWRPPFAVLSEPESMRGNIKKGGEAGQRVARSLRGQSNSSHREDSDNFVVMAHGQGNAEIVKDGSPSLTCNHEAPIVFENHMQDSRIKEVDVCPSLSAKAGTGGGNLPIAFHHKQDPISSDKGLPVETGHGGAVAFQRSELRQRGTLTIHDKAPTLKAETKKGDTELSIYTGSVVRRLTPMECERLQGFQDGYTLVPYRGKPASDGPRYKALGNSMAVPVVRWIGRRIQLWENLKIEGVVA